MKDIRKVLLGQSECAKRSGLQYLEHTLRLIKSNELILAIFRFMTGSEIITQ